MKQFTETHKTRHQQTALHEAAHAVVAELTGAFHPVLAYLSTEFGVHGRVEGVFHSAAEDREAPLDQAHRRVYAKLMVDVAGYVAEMKAGYTGTQWDKDAESYSWGIYSENPEDFVLEDYVNEGTDFYNAKVRAGLLGIEVDEVIHAVNVFLNDPGVEASILEMAERLLDYAVGYEEILEIIDEFVLDRQKHKIAEPRYTAEEACEAMILWG